MDSAAAKIKVTEVCCPVCRSRPPRMAYASGMDFEYDTCSNEFTFRQCRDCRVLYLSPRPDISELGKIYPPEYAPYHFEEKKITLRVRSFLEWKRVKIVKKLVGCGPARILDAGCGGPGFLKLLEKHGSKGWELWGNDIDRDVVSTIENAGYNALCGRFEKIDFDKLFDLILFKQVIEHLDSPAEVLNHSIDLLKPGGFLLIETPNYDAWDAAIFSKRYWGGYHFPRHWAIFDKASFINVAVSAGYTTYGVDYMLSPSFWVQAWHHLLKDHGWPEPIYRLMTHTNPAVLGLACCLDVIQKIIRGRTSNMRIILQKPRHTGPKGQG